MTQKHPIDRASDALGGAGNLAALLGVSAQAVSNWKERGVPIERCVAIEQATGVSRRELRPDDWRAIWPELERRDGDHDNGQRRRAADKPAKA
jgi:DNA-binding transcriptional regulator YdaS (Cro superfamily)